MLTKTVHMYTTIYTVYVMYITIAVLTFSSLNDYSNQPVEWLIMQLLSETHLGFLPFNAKMTQKKKLGFTNSLLKPNECYQTTTYMQISSSFCLPCEWPAAGEHLLPLH